MQESEEAKNALDTVIKKARVHFYKPIQIAEILHNHRLGKTLDLKDLESYRNVSKKWRDKISTRLVGRVSTSSQKYQDNLFENNAIPPKLLDVLGKENKKGGGSVEAYIYKSFQLKLSSLYKVGKYIKKADADSFSLTKLISAFTKSAGLKRSIDKIYEILVYALFSTIVRALRVEVTLEIKNKDKKILQDFGLFIKIVLGVDSGGTKIVLPARLYRVGVTNAADRGLDMWANFGVAVQVKHMTLTLDLAEDIADEIMSDRIVIVCLNAEKKVIEALLKQVGLGNRIQGIITLEGLHEWYKLCLSKKYRGKFGDTLLRDLEREFDTEFPSSREIEPFLKERGYNKVVLPKGWKVE